MAYKVQPGVIGCAIRPAIAGRDRSLEEIMYDTVQVALSDAGITIEDIDGIVVASNDQFDGRSIAVMMASGSVGGVDRDILSTPSASEHALVLGALRVASGQYRTQLIVSWSPTETSSLSEVQRLGADPYFHRS
jgi:acetyl-CoA C-acetyltransferase